MPFYNKYFSFENKKILTFDVTWNMSQQWNEFVEIIKWHNVIEWIVIIMECIIIIIYIIMKYGWNLEMKLDCNESIKEIIKGNK